MVTIINNQDRMFDISLLWLDGVVRHIQQQGQTASGRSGQVCQEAAGEIKSRLIENDAGKNKYIKQVLLCLMHMESPLNFRCFMRVCIVHCILHKCGIFRAQ